ncbi:MAG TPA: UDP-N-acetylmuramate--L-alanine ligase [Acidimicrobiales bacterium]|nr:UDP-N-acetylmuramate--L-alanine ligase [Acidimicrobiales bacterium]
MSIDLTVPRRIHLVGIAGTGMSVIAILLLGMGHTVTGSDIAEGTVVERLRSLGATVRIGHDPAAVDDVDVVTYSSAVPTDNVELVAAAQRGRLVLTRGQLLGAVCATRRTLAVSGTHGKTTTTSMIWSILREAGWHPSCVVGGDLHGVGHGAVWDPEGEWLVVEADESDGMFLELPTEGVVVTNVESDHLEYYGGLQPLREAFARFLGAATAVRVTSADDAGAGLVAGMLGQPGAGGPAVTTFGAAPGADVRLSDIVLHRNGSSAAVVVDGTPVGTIRLAVPGRHNLANANAALALTLREGVPFAAAATALADFREVARRFQWRGEQDGVSYVDDYGHLPSEVKAVIATARTGGWDRIVAVFQPHRYSRTAGLHAEFADAFVDADVLVLTGIYPAGEAPRPGVTGRLILDDVRAAHPDQDVRYVEHRADLAAAVGAILRPGDLCLTLGAGDVTALADELQGASAGGAS